MKTPAEIVHEMLSKDEFSRWLGIQLDSIKEGHCSLSMVARKEMLNGFSILHGGISYSLADSALAFAANAYGNHALSIETSISHHQKVLENERIFAHASPIYTGSKFSNFQVEVKNENGALIASFRGAVFNTQRNW